MTVTRNKSQLGNPSFYELAIKTRGLAKSWSPGPKDGQVDRADGRRPGQSADWPSHIAGQRANEQAVYDGRVSAGQNQETKIGPGREHDFRTAACALRPICM